MANMAPISRVVGLLRSYMGLAPDQVVLYNQQWVLPPDKRLYITVALLNARPYGNTLNYEDSADGKQLLEVQESLTQETYGIDMFSRSQEALDRYSEIMFAFGSTEAQQLSEQHGLKLPRVPSSIQDASFLEGAARVNCFTITAAILCARSRTRVVQYYDDFEIPPKKIYINP